MREKEKIMVTNEGRLDLGSFTWDDQVFTDILVRDNPINSSRRGSSSSHIPRTHFYLTNISYLFFTFAQGSSLWAHNNPTCNQHCACVTTVTAAVARGSVWPVGSEDCSEGA